MFKRVVRAYRKSGLRVPDNMQLYIVKHHPKWEGWAMGTDVYVQRSHCTIELLVHEIAHIIVDQLVDSEQAHAHNRFWALVYGIGYQAAISH